MINDKNKTLTIIFTSLSILIEIFAILLLMVPIAGFIVYIFVTAFAIGMVAIGWILSKKYRVLRIVSIILFFIYLIGIVADISVIVFFLLKV